MTVYPDVKINLGLSVIRKRPDGYHDLETLFVPFRGLGDEIEIVPSDSMRFCASANVTWDNDLTLRAYNILKKDYDLPPVSIRLDKKAPVGAGLGSGSADAAFTLRALNEMFGLGLSDAGLAAYAARLGSDCPFFIYDRPMFGKGRGDVLTPFDIDLSGYEIKVSVPQGVSVSTREAYFRVVPRELPSAASASFARPSSPLASAQSTSPSSPIAAAPSARPLLPVFGDDSSEVRASDSTNNADTGHRLSLREALALPISEWREALLNDFEPSVFALHPEIAAFKARFYAEGAIYASMSGSGSAVFGLFPRR